MFGGYSVSRDIRKNLFGLSLLQAGSSGTSVEVFGKKVTLWGIPDDHTGGGMQSPSPTKGRTVRYTCSKANPEVAPPPLKYCAKKFDATNLIRLTRFAERSEIPLSWAIKISHRVSNFSPGE
jgi:hypothetical protein